MSFHDEIGERCNNLRTVAKGLSIKADALHQIGSLAFGDQLSIMAIQIAQTADDIDQAVGRKLDADFKNTQQSSANVLNTALAGVDVAKRGESRK